MRRLTDNQFIEKAEKVHPYPNNYGYDRVHYIDWCTPVEIYCPRCGVYFWQTPNNHLSGKGCKICGNKRLSERKRLKSDNIIERFNKVHDNKFEYLDDYTGNKEKMTIKCLRCGKIFRQRASNHLRGQGCPFCANHVLKTKDQFEEESIKVHGEGKFSYDEFEYKGNRRKGKIKCLKCRMVFMQSPSNHLKGQGCPYCNESKGENRIKNWLMEKNIRFEAQKRFKDCRNKKTLPFDFYLPDYDMCIEYQGEQHYSPKMYIGKSGSEVIGTDIYNKQRLHDQIKRDYCKDCGIRLLEIRYDEKIEERLTKTIMKGEN